MVLFFDIKRKLAKLRFLKLTTRIFETKKSWIITSRMENFANSSYNIRHQKYLIDNNSNIITCSSI